MSGSNSQQRIRQQRQRASLLTPVLFALFAWLFEFATHSHLRDDHVQKAPASAHQCLVCAAFQAGASAAPFMPFVPVAKGLFTFVTEAAPAPLSPPSLSYRSRAPPQA